jgi:thiamine-monophosphate kinase
MEFQIIRRFLSHFALEDSSLVVGPGDDCAVLRVSPGQEVCVTTDALVENVHFHSQTFSSRDIGYKALAVNLSDIAAMGACPRWFFCSISCPPSAIKRIPGIAQGMSQLAAKTNTVLAGGNFTRSEVLSLHITAAGEVPFGKALTRSGAKPNDSIYVTGTFGDAALALKRAVHRKTRVPDRQRRPIPRIGAGMLAREFAHAAIDVSDGLLQDLGHILTASSVGAEIDAQLIPLSTSFRKSGASIHLALGGGEDYELIFCVPPHCCAAFEKACSLANEKVTLIGKICKKRGLNIKNQPLRYSAGFNHFSSSN